MFDSEDRTDCAPAPPTLVDVRFDGQVWFDFSHRSVWEFYVFVRALARAGGSVALEWSPFVDAPEATAAATFLHLDDPTARGRFLHTMLGLVHLEGADPTDRETVERALSLARLDVEPVDDDDAVGAMRAAGRELGVVAVPSLYRLGPVMAIDLNAAATEGDVIARARTILAVSDDDGLWGLMKP